MVGYLFLSVKKALNIEDEWRSEAENELWLFGN